MKKLLLLSLFVGLFGSIANARCLVCYMVGDPSPLQFADTPVGGVSTLATVTLGMAGSIPLTIGSITVPPDFILVGNNCPATLSASQSQCQLQLEFAPRSAGSISENLKVKYHGLNVSGTVSVDLVGTGL